MAGTEPTSCHSVPPNRRSECDSRGVTEPVVDVTVRPKAAAGGELTGNMVPSPLGMLTRGWLRGRNDSGCVKDAHQASPTLTRGIQCMGKDFYCFFEIEAG
eukprot:gene25144-biopygen22471